MELKVVLEELRDGPVSDGRPEDVARHGSRAVAVSPVVDGCDERLLEAVEVLQGTVERDGQGFLSRPSLAELFDALQVGVFKMGQGDGMPCQSCHKVPKS